MPADVAMHTNFLRLDSNNKSSSSSSSGSVKKSNVDSCWNTENMSGNMILLNSNGYGGRRESVQVKVYRTSVEHFAVIYSQEKTNGRPIGILNLRNTTTERLGDDGFVVSQRGCDDPVSLSFVPENTDDIDYWITAFTPRSSPLLHHSSLPIVEEEEI